MNKLLNVLGFYVQDNTKNVKQLAYPDVQYVKYDQYLIYMINRDNASVTCKENIRVAFSYKSWQSNLL
jgi:hypothetical protein